MFDRMESICLGLGLLVRVLLFFQARIRHYFEESGEFSTPLTSWKRGERRDFTSNSLCSALVVEGIYLRKLNLSPFVGSIVHEVNRRGEGAREMSVLRV